MQLRTMARAYTRSVSSVAAVYMHPCNDNSQGIDPVLSSLGINKTAVYRFCEIVFLVRLCSLGSFLVTACQLCELLNLGNIPL